MNLITQTFFFNDYKVFKAKMLNWANQFNIFCLLDNSGYTQEAASFNCILAAGSRRSLELQSHNGLQQLLNFYDEHPSWLFGHLGYSLNHHPNAKESKPNKTGFGPGFFFEPEIILSLSNTAVTIHAETVAAMQQAFADINAAGGSVSKTTRSFPAIQATINKGEYIAIVEQLRQHIQRGDCYEINFCQHFFAEGTTIDALEIYTELVRESPTPFAAFYKLNDKYCLCASPERYLKKSGREIISQPIKGTSSRSLSDPALDELNRRHLSTSSKEKSENVMIVDLVRNDLSKVCEEGSVVVDELFGIYSFQQVHQMISTVKGVLSKGQRFTAAIEATFPMGSMTGAPKHRVMQLIDQYEEVERGLFSGAIGYVTPGEDFDFNVVIRSLFYNEGEKYISFSAGSGITFYSDAAEEYDECMLKANAILKLLVREGK